MFKMLRQKFKYLEKKKAFKKEKVFGRWESNFNVIKCGGTLLMILMVEFVVKIGKKHEFKSIYFIAGGKLDKIFCLAWIVWVRIKKK